MIVLISNNSINRKKWDACIDKAINGYIYAYSWYLDLVAPDWMALVDGDYKAVFPLPVRKKLGITYIFQPPFVQQLGLFSPEIPSLSIMEDFLTAIPKWIRYGNLNLNKYNLPNVPAHQFLRHRTNELDLILPYPEIAQAYHQNLKRNLKKASGNTYHYVSFGDPQIIIDTFNHTQNKEKGYFRPSDLNILKRLTYEAMQRGNAHVRFLFDEKNQFLSGAIFMESHQKIIFLFSAQTPLGRERNSLALLLDRVIFENANRNLVFDFEGSDNPGLDRYYKAFGAKECVYLQWSMNNLPFLFSFAATSLKKLKSLSRRLC